MKKLINYAKTNHKEVLFALVVAVVVIIGTLTLTSFMWGVMSSIGWLS